MKKILLILFILFSVTVLSKEKYIVCLDPGHQTKGNPALEEIAPNSDKKKAKVTTGTRGVVTKKYESELMLERAIFANDNKADVYIRLHADGSENKNAAGASVLTSSPKNKYTTKVQKESEKFSKILLEEYVKATGAKNRGLIYRDDLTGTNWATVPNTLIELGFMSNAEEDKKLSEKDYQDKIVKGLVNGIDRYLGGK